MNFFGYSYMMAKKTWINLHVSEDYKILHSTYNQLKQLGFVPLKHCPNEDLYVQIPTLVLQLLNCMQSTKQKEIYIFIIQTHFLKIVFQGDQKLASVIHVNINLRECPFFYRFSAHTYTYSIIDWSATSQTPSLLDWFYCFSMSPLLFVLAVFRKMFKVLLFDLWC